MICKLACSIFAIAIAVGYAAWAEEQQNETGKDNPTSSAVSVREADDFVKFHNRVRADVGSPAVKWSPKLARFAQQWANHIAETGEVGHRPNTGEWAQKYGENWAIGIGMGNFDALSAAAYWEDEKQFYTPGTAIPDAENFANFKSGHYTAMIWRTTTEIGAGKATIQTGPRKGYVVIIGNYNPPGNVFGQNPTK